MSFTHGWVFFFYSTPTSSPFFAFLLLSLLPILFLHLYSISFLSGRFLIALCVRSFHMWGSGSPGILLLPCSVADGVSKGRRGEQGIRQPRSWKDPVRYVKDSCSIYLLILRGPHRARCTKIGRLVFWMATSVLTKMEERFIFGRDTCSKGVSNVPFVLSVL